MEPVIQDPVSAITLPLIALSGFLVTYFLIPLLMKEFVKRGITGVDAHKLSKPVIPEMGGVGIVIGILVSSLLALLLFHEYGSSILAFLLVILLTAAVGIYDDLKNLHPVVKPLLTAVACLPLLLLNVYPSVLDLPFIRRARLTLVYPLMLPFAVAVPANAVNNLGVLNGAMSGTCLIAILALLVASFIMSRPIATLLCLIMLGSLLAFHIFNRFPSKIFEGDVGSLAVGAGIGAIAVIGRMEVIGIVALLPHITHSFSLLTGLRKASRHEAWPRPTFLRKDGKLAANEDPMAPITLVRVILAKEPMDERSIVRSMYALSFFSLLLSVVTAFLMVESL